MGRNKDTNDEDGLWDAAMRDVTPIKKPARKETPPTPKPVPVTRTPLTRAATPAPSGPLAREIDRRTRQKLERGHMAIEAVLDLHSHRQGEALEALQSFLIGGYNHGLRCVLVITGKGKDGLGILRTRFKEWVHEPPLNALVLEAVPAKNNHGGSGAFYVLLRRKR